VPKAAQPSALVRSLGLSIRELRTQRGWNLARLAEEADLTRQTVQRVETAQVSMNITTLAALAMALDTTTARLVQRAEGGDAEVRDSDLRAVWAEIPDEQRELALAVLRQFGSTR